MRESKGLSETEKKIIKSRLTGQPFFEMTKDDVRLATDKIMMRGAAICGCELPKTEGFAEIISNELETHIKAFGYDSLTVSEVILALHLNADGNVRYPSGEFAERVEFSGICFNVVYVAKILGIYKSLRNGLDRKFENQIDGYK